LPVGSAENLTVLGRDDDEMVIRERERKRERERE
jgi:hypothetical protein